MKSCKKKKIEIDLEININKKILNEQKFTSISTAASAKNTKKYGISHKKISSANNYYSKFMQNNNHRLRNPYQHQRIPTNKTPQINTRYKNQLDKLNSSISNLKNKYSDLIQQYFSNNSKIEYYKMKFIQAKKENDKEEKDKNKKNIENEKKKKVEENLEKKLKWKAEFKAKKNMEYIKIKNKVEKLKDKNTIERMNYNAKINKSKQKKNKIMKEEKRYIQERIYNQIKNDSKERERKEKIREQKMIKDAEIKQGKEMFALLKIKEGLNNKIKELKTVNNKMEQEIDSEVNKKINDKEFKNLKIPFKY